MHSMTSRETIPGEGAWSRKIRHLGRVMLIRQQVSSWADGTLAQLDAVGVRQVTPESKPNLAMFDFDERIAAVGLLLWSEGHYAHTRGPDRQAPTARPTWWVEAGLPDRRQRSSGKAWTAAAAEAAEVQLRFWEHGLPRSEFFLFGIADVLHDKLGKQDGAEFAAAICGSLASYLLAMVDYNHKIVHFPAFVNRYSVSCSEEQQNELAGWLAAWEKRLAEDLTAIAESAAVAAVGVA